MTPAKIFVLGLVASLTVAGFIVLLTWSGNSDYQSLYTRLSPEDAGAIVTWLKENNIPYKVSSGHDAIQVPSDLLYETRLELASAGLPLGSGVGFEIFDNARLGMTEFVQNVNFQRALQGELSRTINRFDEVEGSRVHIVMGTKSLFAENEEPATASVILKLARGRALSKEQVEAVVHLVSSSVSGLKPENVTVVDNHGKMLAGSGSRSGEGPVNSDQLALQEKLEKGLEDRVRTMLETVLGPGKAVARVSCTLNFTKEEKTEERYRPDSKVVRSEQILNETSGGLRRAEKGVPGILSNTAEGQAAMAGKQESGSSMSEGFNKQERTVNYEISRVTSHILEGCPKVERVSAAVVVDGIHTYVEGEKGKGEWKYSPRSSEEMAKITKIVKRAINFNADRGDQLEVVNIPFKKVDGVWEEGAEGGANKWLSYAREYGPSARTISVVAFLFCVFLFVVRPLLRWLTSTAGPKEKALMQLPKTVSEIESEYVEKSSKIEQAARLLASDEEGSVDLMRRWLSEGKA